MPDLSFESQYPNPVAGVDEAGRGPWAGPVVAAAVILGPKAPAGLDDSKKLTAKRREALFEALSQSCRIGIGIGTVREIDTINIARANDMAMERAIAALPSQPVFALIDGNRVPHGLSIPARALVKGDSRSLSIAAASIVAKVTRDRIMADLARAHPGYGWETNQGYGTRAHRDALSRMGVTPHHRRSFKPIRDVLVEEKLITY